MNYLKSFKLFEEYTDDKTVDIELIKDIFTELTDTYTEKEIEINYSYDLGKSNWIGIGVFSNRNDNSELSETSLYLTKRLLQYYYDETGDEIIACYHVGNYNHFNVIEDFRSPKYFNTHRILILYFNYARPLKNPPSKTTYMSITKDDIKNI